LAGSVDGPALEGDFARLSGGFPGRVGVCATDGLKQACVNPNQHFALQSVMKLLVAMAVLDAVDTRGWRLNADVILHKNDLSLYVQPLANIVNRQGSFRTTIGDVVRRAVVDSDSAATDFLVRRLGGAEAVQSFLDRKGIHDVRFDRDERHLQTEIAGIEWRTEFVDASVLDRAISQVPERVRNAANRRYQTDIRDTATPLGMARMLYALDSGKLLSPSSTEFLLDVMRQTITFPDRLKAGTAAGWTILHKTGTSGTWKGLTVATNDVGILKAPDGGSIAIAVFVADSPAPDADRAALIANMARRTTARWR
jgi:beta-lactamase class A